MNCNDRIIDLAEKYNGYIVAEEVTANNIPSIYLTKLVDEKRLIRVSRGLYMLPSCFEDDYYRLGVMTKHSVFSLETALYLHNFSDRIPVYYNITVPRNYSGSLLKEKNVKLSYVKQELLDLGVIEIKSPMGQKIRVYDLERTICDIIKFKSKVEPEIFTKALKQYAKSKEKNLNNLVTYAKALNVEKEVRNYLEILL